MNSGEESADLILLHQLLWGSSPANSAAAPSEFLAGILSADWCRKEQNQGPSVHHGSELLGVLGQLLRLLPQLPGGLCVGIFEGRALGGQGQVLEEAAEAAAAVQDVAPGVPLLGLLAQRIHQLLPHHDDEFAVGDEDFGGLLVAEAGGEHPDGLVQGGEAQPAVLWEGDFPGRVLPAGIHSLFCTWQNLEKGLK